MKFCPVVPEICRGQVHGAWKERRRIRRIRIIIRNWAKTISLQTLLGRLKYGDELCLKTFVTDGRTGQKQCLPHKRGDILIINKTIKYIYYTDLSGIAGKCQKSDEKKFYGLYN